MMCRIASGRAFPAAATITLPLGDGISWSYKPQEKAFQVISNKKGGLRYVPVNVVNFRLVTLSSKHLEKTDHSRSFDI